MSTMTMNDAGAKPASGTIDISSTRPVPFTRLVAVELRKMRDTRAGFWLLVGIAAITVVAVGATFVFSKTEDRTFFQFLTATATPQGFLLPVLGILLITSEWSQRTALTTFTLEASRARVIAAKVAGSLLVGMVAILIAGAVAALAAVLGGADDAFGEFGAESLVNFAILQGTGLLQGLAFGLLFLASAPAIVTYFVLPGAFSIVSNMWGALEKHKEWVDLGSSQQPLMEKGFFDLTSTQYMQLVVTIGLWVVLPFAIGLWRTMRAEVK